MARLAAACALACLLVVAAPTASAHERYTTADGKYELVIGHLNEPVTTYTKSGLDLAVRFAGNSTPVLGVQNMVQSALVAPDNTTMTAQLRGQFGKPGSYSFDRPYILTMPGQYMLRLSGNIAGTDVSGEYKIAGAVPDVEESTFPDRDVPDLAELRERLEAAEARIAELEKPASPVTVTTTEARDAPDSAVFLMVGLAFASLLLRRRAA